MKRYAILRQAIRSLAVCERGGTAVEFGLLLPAFVSLIVGTLYAGLAVYSATGLHSAVEQAARCYSVNATTCGSSSATVTYAQTQYHGISSPNFTASTASCGHLVSGTVTVGLNDMFANLSIPLSATACFP
jgi:Flp pilus assembly protein TadG